jgi:class 3 adenylate cyclase
MFIDLVGSTEMGERLTRKTSAKSLRHFMGRYRAQPSSRDSSLIHKDGILAYFATHSHEADAERAIRSGLAIAEAVGSLNTLAGPPGTLSVRIGIDTGFVVAGDLIGFGASLETAVVGDTPNLAARLQTAAEPGTVVISNATRLLVGSLFEYRELALSNLKGRSGVEHACVVLGESAIDSRYEALRRGQSSLVGRTEELELMLRRWEQAKTGEGRVILLTGDPGIGKSRMISALEQCIGGSPHLCLRFFCSPHHLDTPLYPIARHIERAANSSAGTRRRPNGTSSRSRFRGRRFRGQGAAGGPGFDPVLGAGTGQHPRSPAPQGEDLHGYHPPTGQFGRNEADAHLGRGHTLGDPSTLS